MEFLLFIVSSSYATLSLWTYILNQRSENHLLTSMTIILGQVISGVVNLERKGFRMIPLAEKMTKIFTCKSVF